jgi:hypothetical protein
MLSLPAGGADPLRSTREIAQIMVCRICLPQTTAVPVVMLPFEVTIFLPRGIHSTCSVLPKEGPV